MREKFQQFFNQNNGNFVEVNDPTNKNQCIDLAYAFCDFLGIPRDTIRHLYAKEIYTKATDLTKKYFNLIANSPEGIPEVGDLVVFSEKIGGIAGHISISNGTGDVNNFESFDQNFGVPKYSRIVKHDYKAVIGWLRPRIEINTNMPNWLINLLQENNLSIEKEGDIRAFFEKARKYDDETKQLKEQVKSANEALADRAREVSLLTEDNQKLTDKATEKEELYNKARGERDISTWERQKIEIENKSLREEIKNMDMEIEKLKAQNPLMAYGRLERLLSLFRKA